MALKDTLQNNHSSTATNIKSYKSLPKQIRFKSRFKHLKVAPWFPSTEIPFTTLCYLALHFRFVFIRTLCLNITAERT